MRAFLYHFSRYAGSIEAEEFRRGGIARATIDPQLGKFLLVEGTLQNQDGVISVKASAVRVLDFSEVDIRSHDFH